MMSLLKIKTKMEQRKSEYVRVNENKDLWELDYEKRIAVHKRQGIDFEDLHKSENQDNNKKDSEKSLRGYNGDITQYLEEKGFMWKQLSEDSVSFWHKEKE
jgi:hypothetical protein